MENCNQLKSTDYEAIVCDILAMEKFVCAIKKSYYHCFSNVILIIEQKFLTFERLLSTDIIETT